MILLIPEGATSAINTAVIKANGVAMIKVRAVNDSVPMMNTPAPYRSSIGDHSKDRKKSCSPISKNVRIPVLPTKKIIESKVTQSMKVLKKQKNPNSLLFSFMKNERSNTEVILFIYPF